MRTPTPRAGYAVAVAATALAAGARAVYDWWFGPEPVYLLPFLVPVALAGWVGGLRCGLFATAFSALVAVYFFTTPFFSFGVASPGDAVRIVVFVAVGVFVTVLNHRLHAYRHRAEEHTREALARQAELEQEIANRSQAERRYRMLLEGVPQLVWTCRPDGWCDYLSRQWVESTGAPEADQLGYGWSEAVHPDDRAALMERWQRSVASGAPLDTEFRIRGAAGGYRWFQTRAVLFRDADGASKWFGTNTDIHDAKESGERLRAGAVALEAQVAERTREIEGQRRLLDAVLDALPAAVIIADPTGRVTRMNRACEQVWGPAPPVPENIAEYAGWVGYWPETGRRIEPHEWAMSRALLAGETCPGELIEFERFGDRSRRFVLNAGAPVLGARGEIVAGVVATVDVTAQVTAEAAVRASEERFQAFMAHAPLAAWVTDADSRGVYTNAGFDRHLGLPPGAFIGRVPADLWPAEVAREYTANNRRVLASGAAVAGEEPFVGPDGSLGVAHVVKFPMSGPRGEPLVGGVAIDVTTQRRAEAALAASEERFRAATEASLDAVYLLSAERGPGGAVTDFRFAELNGRGAALLSRPREQVLGRRLCELLPVNRTGGFFDKYVRVVETGEPLTEEFTVAPADGLAAAHLRHQVVRAGDGVAITTQDITARKRAEAALRASEEKFRLAFEHAPIGVSLTGTDGRWLQVNRSLCDLTGYTERELLASDFQTLTHPDDLGKDLDHLQRFLDGAAQTYQTEKRYFHKRGHLIHVHLSVSMVRDERGAPLYFICHIMDITARKDAEVALRASEDRFRSSFENAPIGLALVAPDGRWLRVNRSLCGIVGYAEPDLLATDFQAITHPDDLGADLGLVRQVLDGALPAYQMEKRYFHKDGHVVHTLLAVSLVRDGGGRPLHFISQIVDITEAKRAEAALRLSEERFRRLVDGIADHAIFMLDPDGHVVSWNPGAEQIVGYTAEEIIGRHFSAFYPPAVAAAGHPQHELAVAAAVGRYQEEGERVRKGGALFWADVTISALRDDTGRHVGFVKFTHDVTARKRSQEQVRASLREKEVLLKEIHHRVKNNLQIISSLLHLQSSSVPDRAVQELFNESRGRVKSMALIHERLYRSGNLAGVDLAEYVRQLAADLYRAYRVSEEAVRFDVDVTVPPLPIDVAIPCGLLLNEMLSNCLKHAFRAGAAGRIGVSFRRAAGAVVLRVTDDGPGFPPGTDFDTINTFGLQLIDTLADQLNGRATLGSGAGAAVTVTFPDPTEAPR